jgi:hypothetical protein
MLQCVPLADSCLALGQASCRRARQLAQQYAAEGMMHGTMCSKQAACMSNSSSGCIRASVPTHKPLVGVGYRVALFQKRTMSGAKLVRKIALACKADVVSQANLAMWGARRV